MIAHEGARLANAAIGSLNGAFIAAGIGGTELLLLRGASSFVRALRRLPFIALVALKTLVYVPIVTFLPAMHLLGGGFSDLFQRSPVDLRTEVITVAFSMAATLVFVIVVQATHLVGGPNLLDLIVGRYRQPRRERRFFLFADVVGFTAIAERLGPLDAHRMLAHVFALVAEPIARRRGEIYQYVGDQIVVTWTEQQGTVDGRPVRCFIEMQALLEKLAHRFDERFGVVPELRAALHLGDVVTGEVGEQRRAIVFHGDVVNATSRLEDATRQLGCRFIVSADALQALGRMPGVEYHDLGAIPLRGRKKTLRAWAVLTRWSARPLNRPH